VVSFFAVIHLFFAAISNSQPSELLLFSIKTNLIQERQVQFMTYDCSFWETWHFQWWFQ